MKTKYFQPIYYFKKLLKRKNLLRSNFINNLMKKNWDKKILVYKFQEKIVIKTFVIPSFLFRFKCRYVSETN